MNIKSLLYQVAVDLNDAAPGHEFTTWSEQQLRAYLEEAIQTAFTRRPDLFIQTRVVKVEPCSVVQDVCDCTKLRRVIGQTDENGRIIKLLRPRKRDDALLWTGRTCHKSPKEFQLSHYTIDEASNKLWLYPQVPAGLDVYVLLECVVMPEAIDDNTTIPPELVGAVVQWALYRAKMVDGENSPTVVSVANAHKAAFWELLTAQAEQKSVAVEGDDGNTN